MKELNMPFLNVNGIDLYYEVKGEGQTVVFIHGLGSSCQDWEKQEPVFSKQYQVVMLDLRGHGKSQKPSGPYSMALFASDVAGVIRSLNLAPVHVVGISLGGMIALQLAADYPELVRSFVAANNNSEMIVRTWKDRWEIFMRTNVVRLLGMRKMGEVLGRNMFPDDSQADVRKLIVERWAENDPKAYLASIGAIIGWSVTERLADIAVPALILSADKDYTPVADKEAIVARMPNAELAVISDSRHATPVDQPEKFNEVVLNFISKH